MTEISDADRIDLRLGSQAVTTAARRIAALFERDEPVVVDLSVYAREGHWIGTSIKSTVTSEGDDYSGTS